MTSSIGGTLGITHVEVTFKRQECSHKLVIARFELLSGGQRGSEAAHTDNLC